MYESILLRLFGGRNAVDYDGTSDPASAEDSAHLCAAAGDIPDGSGGQRGGVRGHREAPRHAHCY